jgi:hypothetical protein
MKESPIIFSPPMIAALLRGDKHQTRRLRGTYSLSSINSDILWVCESVWIYGKWVKAGLSSTGNHTYSFKIHDSKQVLYETPTGALADKKLGNLGWKHVPSIHMPRWASRITLEVTGRRQERLQDISVEDALDEGVTHRSMNDPRIEFAQLWNSINGEDAWDINPIVWVINFKVIKPIQE